MKKENLGYILGSICFLPTFLVVVRLGYMNFWLALILLIASQSLWISSITLCTWNLENKNKELKRKVAEFNNEK